MGLLYTERRGPPPSDGVLLQKKVEYRGLRVTESKRRSVLQRARADGDGMRMPPGHLITGAGREEVLVFGACLFLLKC